MDKRDIVWPIARLGGMDSSGVVFVSRSTKFILEAFRMSANGLLCAFCLHKWTRNEGFLFMTVYAHAFIHGWILLECTLGVKLLRSVHCASVGFLWEM